MTNELEVRTPPPLLADYFTAEQVAAGLNVTPRTFFRWRASDYGPAPTMIGGRLYFHRETVAAWIKSREQGARPPRAHRRTRARA